MFRADGTGTLNARSVSVDAPPFAGAASGEYTFQYTYTIGEDGKLSITMVPGTYKGTFLTGARAGQTDVHVIPVETGFIGEGGRTIGWGRTRRSSITSLSPLANSSSGSAIARAP